ncbi:hypothetical protein RHMOL_Rhmol02G0221300 [Rhododendron molle]|uniref:Uncharacterized protein n=1 Tax=Rhododendron molle TaxID=49168 RepID=A0ACC0PT89_RHOML|nr:hypothetical protein RHMOL_Rhmol02G0221300 [Rhododendron molle]
MEKNQSDKQLNSITLLNQMASDPYYLFHFLAFFSYIPVRCSASHVLSPPFSSYLLHREIQAVIAFSLLTAIKMVRKETWEAFIAETLFFAKIFLFGIALVVDYHLALWYLLVFLVSQILLRSVMIPHFTFFVWFCLAVVYTLTQQPPYQGIGATLPLTPLQLEALLTDGNTSRFWLVEYRELSSSTCVQTSRFFPELSITYSNKNLSFGVVDLGLFPNTAEKFGISLGSSDKLPKYILFENGVEITRFPEMDFEAKTSTFTITKKLLCRHFELDRHLLDYINDVNSERIYTRRCEMCEVIDILAKEVEFGKNLGDEETPLEMFDAL